jgi:hypothetical protein
VVSNDSRWVSGEIYKKAWAEWLKFLESYKAENAAQQAY